MPLPLHSTTEPARILMIKGYSAGIGDLLRSSAAWRALKNKFPSAGLNFLFLTKDQGYVSETLMSRHHLLANFFVIDRRTKGLRDWRHFLSEIAKVMDTVNPDLVIDFDHHGLRTPIISAWMRLKYHVMTVGINQFPLRSFFYSICSTSTRQYALRRGLEYPLEVTSRDFVALSALGIERDGLPIELEETHEGEAFRRTIRWKYGIAEDSRILGVNVGCGTPDATYKRPDLSLLSRLIGHLVRRYSFTVILSGATFEKDINEEFMILLRRRVTCSAYNLAGETDLLELSGLIKACDMFVSTDSGPYHMAVALRVPTLAVFVRNSRAHFHSHPWISCALLISENDIDNLLKEADRLLNLHR